MDIKNLVDLLSKIGTIIVYITAITGSIYYYKYKHTVLKYLLLVLWYAVINESLGYYIRVYTSINNTLLYNIYYLIYFSFLFLLFRRYVKENKHKKWITLFHIIYVISFFINGFNQDYLQEIQVTPYIIGGSLIITSIIFYFSEILNTNKVLYVSKNLLFWVSVGLLLIFAGTIPVRFIINYWDEDVVAYDSLIKLVSFILYIVMYICFIIGFICSEKDSKY
ncbi:hypothetical protein [Pontimicrobium sp. MEBiC06410]